MKRSVFYVLLIVVLLLGACAPNPTAAPVQPATSAPVPTQPVTTGGAYTLPEGAEVQPVPLAAGAQFTGTLAYKPGNKARIAYMPSGHQSLLWCNRAGSQGKGRGVGSGNGYVLSER